MTTLFVLWITGIIIICGTVILCSWKKPQKITSIGLSPFWEWMEKRGYVERETINENSLLHYPKHSIYTTTTGTKRKMISYLTEYIKETQGDLK